MHNLNWQKHLYQLAAYARLIMKWAEKLLAHFRYQDVLRATLISQNSRTTNALWCSPKPNLLCRNSIIIRRTEMNKSCQHTQALATTIVLINISYILLFKSSRCWLHRQLRSDGGIRVWIQDTTHSNKHSSSLFFLPVSRICTIMSPL